MTSQTSGSHGGSSHLSLLDHLGILARHRILLAGTVALCAGSVVLFTLFRPPSFRAQALLLLEESATTRGILGELSALSHAPPALAEIEVLRSRTLAAAVAASPGESPFGPDVGQSLTGIVDDPERYWPWPNLRRTLLGGTPPTGDLKVEVLAWPRGGFKHAVRITFEEPDRVRLAEATVWGSAPVVVTFEEGKPVEYRGARLLLHPSGEIRGRSFLLSRSSDEQAVHRLLGALSVVETQRGAGVIAVSYHDCDPVRAAEVANALVRGYLIHNRSRLSRQAGVTVAFIEQEIDRIRADLEAAEQDLVAFQEQAEAVLLSDSARALIDALSELELERARFGLRIHHQERLLALLEGGEPAWEAAAAAGQEDPVTLSLLEGLAGMMAKKAEMEQEATPLWPPLIELNARIAETRTRLRAGIEARTTALQKQDQDLGQAIERYREKMDGLPATEQELARFQRRSQSFGQIYTFLLGQLQEAKIAEATAVETAEVIDWAVPPISRNSPRLTLNLAMGLLLGLLAGMALAHWVEAASGKVITSAQLEATTKLPQATVIPDFRRGMARSRGGRNNFFLALRDAPESLAAEAYRALRAHVVFVRKSRDIRALAITSSTEGEGKSVTTANLAVALAQSGARVLLVDADLRRPVVHKYFRERVVPGLSEVLTGKNEWAQVVRPAGIENLQIVCAGESSDRPGDLLASGAMSALVKDLRNSFDFVLFDIPPVLAVADAAGFVSELDGMFLLCRSNRTPGGMVAGATQMLRMTGAKLMGSILNAVRFSRFGGYGYGYGYENRKGKEK
jgi:tyrosine-protein kinase Etk/Wzc